MAAARRSGVPEALADGPRILPAMQPPQQIRPRGRSAFVAAFLSLLFPGLGHVYLGAYRRGLGWAAPPFLLVALAAGFAIRLNTFDLAGLAVQAWFLNGVFVLNLITLAYRAGAIVDAWWIARRVGPAWAPAATRPSRPDRSGRSRFAGSGLPFPALASLAGLTAVLLVMSVAHVAVARYDLLLAGTADCIFSPESGACGPGASEQPGASDQGPGSSDEVAVPTPPGTVGPPLQSSAPQTAWDGTSRLNILLIGADEQNGGHNTDTMITVSIDPTTNQVVMFTLPRDTVDVPIPAGPARNFFGPTFPGKINQYFSTVSKRSDWYPPIPGIPNGPGYNGLKAIMGNALGLNIQYFVEVNFAGFEKIVDALGGLTVNVQVPVVDDHYPASHGDLERLYIAAGMQHMDGSYALQYARSRHTSSDFDRGARQQRILVSLREQTNIATVLPQLDTLTAALKSSITTDIPRELVPQLLQVADKVDARSIRSVIFTPPYYQTEFLSSPRGYIIEPNMSRIRQAVKDAFTVDPAFAEARDAVAEEGAEVWVLNGSGQAGEASTLSSYLQYLGLAASAPNQKPSTAGLRGTTIKAYNGADQSDPLTTQLLQKVFGVTVTPVTDASVRVDFIVITAKSTPLLTPPPVP